MLDRAPTTIADNAHENTGIRHDPSAVYSEILDLIERLHRLCLHVIKIELRRLGLVEVTSVQALLLFRIGHRELTAGELASRGYYHGTNVSYTLSKLVESGFLHHRRHPTDGRAVLISLTQRGEEVCDIVTEIFGRHAEEHDVRGDNEHGRLDALCGSLRELEHFWIERRFKRLSGATRGR